MWFVPSAFCLHGSLRNILGLSEPFYADRTRLRPRGSLNRRVAVSGPVLLPYARRTHHEQVVRSRRRYL